jgi:hypothetical protein
MQVNVTRHVERRMFNIWQYRLFLHHKNGVKRSIEYDVKNSDRLIAFVWKALEWVIDFVFSVVFPPLEN